MSARKKALFICIYLGLLLALLEALVRVALAFPAISHRIRGADSASNRLAWVEQRKQKSGTSMEGFFDHDPNRGWHNRAGLKDKGFLRAIVSTNSKGLRGAAEYSYERTAGKTRILALGDSFTFGAEVNDDQTYCACLQQLLPETEVLNLGVNGYGHDQMLKYLVDEGLKYGPDIVLLGFLQLDIRRNLLTFRDYAKPKCELTKDGLRFTNIPVPSPEEMLRWEWARPKTFDLCSILVDRYTPRSRVKKAETKVTSAILDEIIRVTREAGATPVFVYLPHRYEYMRDDELTPGEKSLRKFCQQKANPYISARPLFVQRRREGVSLDLQAEGHWNPAGYRLAAEAIKDGLLEAGLLKAAP